MRFMTTGDVAAACQITIPTVKRWIREGHFAAFQTAGGHYRVAEDELERFRAARHMPAVTVGSGELPKILVVDDDATLLAALSAALTGEGEYKVEVAEDGYEGLIKLGSFRPDILILDIRMLGLDGFQVCRRVKADPVTHGTKILAISGYVAGAERGRVFEAGADGFLAKPFQFEVLRAEVVRLLAGKPRRAHSKDRPST